MVVFAPAIIAADTTLDLKLKKQKEALHNGDPDVSLVEVMALSEKIEVRDFFVQSGFSRKDALMLAEERKAVYEKCLSEWEEVEGSSVASGLGMIFAFKYCKSLSDSAIGFTRDNLQHPDES